MTTQLAKRKWLPLIRDIPTPQNCPVLFPAGDPLELKAPLPCDLFAVITSSTGPGRPITRHPQAMWRNSRDRRSLSQSVVSCSERREGGSPGPTAEKEAKWVLVFENDPLGPEAEAVRNTWARALPGESPEVQVGHVSRYRGIWTSCRRPPDIQLRPPNQLGTDANPRPLRTLTVADTTSF